MTTVEKSKEQTFDGIDKDIFKGLEKNDSDVSVDGNSDIDDETSSINNYSDNSDVDDYSDIEDNSIDPVINNEKKNKSETIEQEEKTVNDFLQSDEIDIDNDSIDDLSDDEFSKLEYSREALEDVHKSLKSINYIEVDKLTNIVRDKNNYIQDINHTTVPILSKYEKTKVIGLRAKQINNGAKPFITIDENIIDGYIIAEKELYQKKIPFIIKRPISYNKFEYWKLEDLECV